MNTCISFGTISTKPSVDNQSQTHITKRKIGRTEKDRSKIQRISLVDTGHCFELTNKFDNKKCDEFDGK